MQLIMQICNMKTPIEQLAYKIKALLIPNAYNQIYYIKDSWQLGADINNRNNYYCWDGVGKSLRPSAASISRTISNL